MTGEPTPELTWQLNGEPVTIEGRYTITDRDELHLLQVHDVVPGDTGVYKVTAANSLGEASCSADMTVQGMWSTFFYTSVSLNYQLFILPRLFDVEFKKLCLYYYYCCCVLVNVFE